MCVSPPSLATQNLLCGDIPSEVQALTAFVTTVSIATGNSIGTPCPTQDFLGLSALYASTDGSTWSTNGEWMSTSHVCDWYGISCASGDATEIQLESHSLQGSLPTEVRVMWVDTVMMHPHAALLVALCSLWLASKC